MTRDLELQLFERCPMLYRYRSDEGSANQHYMLDLGINCGDGWFPLILDVSVKIETLIEGMKQVGHQESLLPVALWVKEKYGGLLFDTDNSTDEIDRLVILAEDRSMAICAVCGDAGKLQGHYWSSCLCDSC